MKRLAPFLQLEMLSVLFLTAPLFIFVLNWISLTYALALCLGLIILFWKHFQDPINIKGIEIEWKYFLILFAVAFVWVYFSGIGGFTFQNGDWKKHYAMFFDLATQEWPIVYPDPLSHTGNSHLVYYFGYYLIPSLVGQSFGFQAMTDFLMFYTAFGITLGFYWLRVFTGHKSILLVFLFTWTSGLDIVGWLTVQGHWPDFQQHLEWWADLHMQYSATTNLLFWVPQQVLAAWVGFPLLLNSLDKQKYELTSLGVVALPLWSPFICIGVAPFLIWKFIVSRPKLKNLVLPIVVVLSFTVIFYFYYESSINSMSSRLSYWRLGSAKIWFHFILFHLLEYLIFFAVIFWCWKKEEWRKYRALFVIALVSLMLIPIRESGLWNDWIMRTSIPAIYLMWVWLLGAMFNLPRRELKYTVIGLLIVIGSVTTFKEYERSLDWHSFHRRALYPLRSMTHEFFDARYKTQYFAPGDGKFHTSFSSHND